MSDMSKNGMTKKRVSKQSRADRAVETIEALLAVERMENEADYRLRGRHLEPLTDEALKRRWLQCLRREFNAARRRRTEMDDIGAELSLRGIANVKLPPDLLELITADMKKLMRQESQGSSAKYN
jgi:hypothetical protein